MVEVATCFLSEYKSSTNITRSRRAFRSLIETQQTHTNIQLPHLTSAIRIHNKYHSAQLHHWQHSRAYGRMTRWRGKYCGRVGSGERKWCVVGPEVDVREVLVDRLCLGRAARYPLFCAGLDVSAALFWLSVSALRPPLPPSSR